MTTIDYAAPRLAAELLPHLVLLEGGHRSREQGLCVMEAAAWIAGEPHSDRPQCASPLVTRVVQRINDSGDQDMRDALRDRLPQIVGSRGTPEVESRRNLEFIYLLLSVRFGASLDALATAPRVAKCKSRLLAAAATLRALTREDGPDTWRAAAEQARDTLSETRRKYPAYADAYADVYASADAYAEAYAYADAYAYAYAEAYAEAEAYAYAEADAYAEAYADAEADAYAEAYAEADAYAYAEPRRRAELKAARATDALAMLDAILAIRE